MQGPNMWIRFREPENQDIYFHHQGYLIKKVFFHRNYECDKEYIFDSE